MTDAEYTVMWGIAFFYLGVFIICVAAIAMGVLETRAKRAEREARDNEAVRRGWGK